MNTLKNLSSKLAERFLGYITVHACRADMIRLLNAFRNKKVRFWGLRADDKDVWLKLSLFGCDEALEAAREANVALTVTRRVGLPFFIHRYRGRAGLAVGAVLAAVMVFASMLFVWEIDITGSDKISQSRIEAVLKKCGLYVGAYIPGINTHAVEERTILTFPDLSSVAVVVTGTHVAVDVIERSRPPVIHEAADGQPSSLYASCDGIVRFVSAESGKAVVKPGDVVAEGDLLVTGIYEDLSGFTVGVRSMGEVRGETYHDFVISVPLCEQVREYTGGRSKKTVATILGHSFELFFGEIIPFEQFDAEITQSSPRLFGIFKTPIRLTTLTAREYRLKTVEITTDEAEKKAIAAFNSKLEEYESGELISKSYEVFIDEESDCVTLVGSYSILCDIAREGPAVVPDEDGEN